MKKEYKNYLEHQNNKSEGIVVEKKFKNKKQKVIFYVFLCIFLISLICLASIVWKYLDARIKYSKINKKYTTVENKKVKEKKVDFEGLSKVNSDIVAWIDFRNEPSIIDYPVVQGKDNNFYLKHAFDKKSSGSACIFEDIINDKEFLDYNTILYGHNMNDKSMFAGLRNYVFGDKQNFYDNNDIFYIYTPAGKNKNIRYEYKIFSAYTIEVSQDESAYTVYKKDGYSQEYVKWANDLKAKSVVKSKFDFDRYIKSQDSRIVTLSTCTNRSENGRIIVHGILVNKKQIK